MSNHRHVIPPRHFSLLLLDHFWSRSSPNFSPLSQTAFSTFVQEYAQVEDEIRRLWTEVGKIGVGVRLFIHLELLKSSQASSSLSPLVLLLSLSPLFVEALVVVVHQVWHTCSR